MRRRRLIATEEGGGAETAINLASSFAATAFSSNPMMLNSKILFPIGCCTKEDGRESGLAGLRRVGIGGRGASTYDVSQRVQTALIVRPDLSTGRTIPLMCV